MGDVPTPTPGPGEVQVRVSAAAMNHIDLWLRQGLPALPVALPHVAGGDVCGVSLGARPGREGDARSRRRRSRASSTRACPAAAAPPAWPAATTSAPTGRCSASRRRAVRPSTSSSRPPTWCRRRARACRSTTPQLAAIPTVFMTAWQMLVDRAAIQQGETVLVIAGGSGVGTAAIQIAKLYGARVIATASDRREAGRGARAGRGRDHQPRDRRHRRRGQAADRPARRRHRRRPRRRRDLREVGPRLRARRAHRRLRRDGRVRAEAEPPPRLLAPAQRSRARPWPARPVFSRLMDLFAAGRLRPVVDRVLPLAEVAAAHKLLESRAIFGKLVLTP